MRPVNLIPPEDRRGQRAPLRAGSASYALLAGLAVAVVAVTALVLTGNSVSDKESELATLEGQRDSAVAQAEALAPYAEFATLRDERQATITSLAESRFDWERVLRELSLILPDDVWLIRVTGTSSPDAVIEGAEDVLRSGAPGPALSLIGCGASQESVAGFAAALEDIDGVTRVGIAKSQKPEQTVSGSSRDDCRTRNFIPRFEITAAFDEAPVAAAGTPAVPSSPTTPAAAPTGEDGGVAGAEAESASAESSAATQTDSAQNATNVIPGAAR